MSGLIPLLQQALAKHAPTDDPIINLESATGGCISKTYRATTQANKHWFVKTNRPDQADMFHAEYEALLALNASQAIRVPQPVVADSHELMSFLIMEYIPLTSAGDSTNAGEQLAAMHQHTAEQFGWYRDNTIGSTAQSNRQHHDWTDFWREERLLPQLRLARENGYSHAAYDKGMALAETLPSFFSGYTPKASLLHGDLWNGNLSFDTDGHPVIYDPATYYGDREADIAMTELFGGFDTDFYAGYNAISPLDTGYKTRKTLYNLYHILNHFNLFGSSYATQAESMTDSLLAAAN